jgi:D-3-phosphoglycerate dehydrogenase
VPGVVGKVGTILGRHQVNIGNFALGRKEGKADPHAVAVVQVDSPAMESALKEIGALPEIADVRGISL